MQLTGFEASALYLVYWVGTVMTVLFIAFAYVHIREVVVEMIG